MMKLLLVGLLIALASALPYKHQIALVNSLEVGRDEDPMTWGCEGCDATNQPIHSYIIEEQAQAVRCALSVYEEYTVLAFRYTKTLKNIWQDILWTFQRQDEGAPQGCKVQKTWDNMWNTIRDDVLAGLRKYAHTKRLIITGISLGGALSELTFVDVLNTKEFDNVEVITFGTPRVGNKKWAAWFDTLTTSTRIYIKRDPIAFLPRCLTPICNYRQVGVPVVCNKRKQQCITKNKKEEDELEMNMSTIISDLKEEYSEEIMEYLSQIKDHQAELLEGDLQGIIDHIFGYKKIKDYDLVL